MKKCDDWPAQVVLGMKALGVMELGTEKERAFAGLLDRQGRFLYRVAFGLLRNQADAEDAVQETLLKLFRGETWWEVREERAYLARVAWRVGLDRPWARRVGDEDVTEMEIAAGGETVEERMAGEGSRRCCGG